MNPQPHTTLKITVCSANRGIVWWKAAWQMMRTYLANWYALGVGYLLCAILPAVFLVLSGAENLVLLWTILVPCLQIGIVSAAWSQVKGEPPQMQHLFNGFKSDVKTLLAIGLVLAILNYAIAKIDHAIWGDRPTMIELMQANSKNPEALMALYATPDFWLQPMLQIGLVTVVLMLGWVSPMLVVFLHTKVGTALIYSLKAAVLNWRALGMYALYATGVMFLVSLVAAMLMLLAGPTIFAVLGFLFVVFVVPTVTVLLIVSSFVAYCDIFHPEDRVFDK